MLSVEGSFFRVGLARYRHLIPPTKKKTEKWFETYISHLLDVYGTSADTPHLFLGLESRCEPQTRIKIAHTHDEPRWLVPYDPRLP